MLVRGILVAVALFLTVGTVRAQPPEEAKGVPLVQVAQRARVAAAKVAAARADLELAEERAAWAARMVKKGYVSPAQLKADEARAAQARIAYEEARRALEALTGGSKK